MGGRRAMSPPPSRLWRRFRRRRAPSCRRRARWLPPKSPTPRTIGARAIRELDQIPVPTSQEQAQNYYWIRGRSAFLTGHPVEGTRALVERERFLTDPAALRANRDELFDPSPRGRRARPAAEGAAENRPHRRRLAGLGAGGCGAGAQSRARRCGAGRLEAAVSAASRPTTACSPRRRPRSPSPPNIPNQIALLLPLSGRAEAIGVAVRDGFIAAYLSRTPPPGRA